MDALKEKGAYALPKSALDSLKKLLQPAGAARKIRSKRSGGYLTIPAISWTRIPRSRNASTSGMPGGRGRDKDDPAFDRKSI
jgi:hypothetical protein